MEEYERAFQDLKKFLAEPPVLSKPRDREPLYIYLSVTEKVISSVLVREEEKNRSLCIMSARHYKDLRSDIRRLRS